VRTPPAFDPERHIGRLDQGHHCGALGTTEIIGGIAGD
jgi:hypothetical protein